MAQSPDVLEGMQRGNNGEPSVEGQWYKANTVYQILYVEPSKPETKRESLNLTTSILAKTRGSVSKNEQISENGQRQNTHPSSFEHFELDQETIDKLKDYPRQGEQHKLSSYLPSPGVIFPDGFMKALSSPKSQSQKIEQTELGNFYQPIRSILYSRKISQLIAKTWWSYLEAKEKGLWSEFIEGRWDNIIKFKSEDEKIDGLYILDGLIAREIFLFAGGNPVNNPYSESDTIYLRQLTREPVENARFLILPSSKSWQGISLSLLLAGQAYYKIGGKYHQISQPIFSTGEIVYKYSLEVDWNRFNGDIKEIIISQEKPWVAYHTVIPYPTIPSDADQGNIEKWAKAEDDDGDLPFYVKTEDKKNYLIDVNYFRSPYPYIPLSCS